MTCGRDPVKAANAVASVKSLTGSSHVHGFAGDLSDFADIRRFAAEVSQVLQTARAGRTACSAMDMP